MESGVIFFGGIVLVVFVVICVGLYHELYRK